MSRLPFYLLLCGVVACSDTLLNSPYPATDGDAVIYYNTFSERPKHLDPARSYSSNEYVFLGQIYEPPLQYHFLKRPYQLTPLTSLGMPKLMYFDGDGLPVESDQIAAIERVVYRIVIKEDVLYQPHPALATDKTGSYLYHQLTPQDLHGIHHVGDFEVTGTRRLSAADYVYQIKRMAHPNIHSPIAGLMGQYIAGFSELTAKLVDEGGDIDLRDYDLEGARVIDEVTFEIVLKNKYPQFLYWLAMPFFAPLPWEADVFYGQAGMSERNITLDWYPLGTGPFMLSENNPNRRMVLERNPNFRGEAFPDEGEINDRRHGFLDDAGKMMPFIDKAVFSLEKESIPAWNKFLQGYYDTSGIISDSFDQAVQITAQGDAMLTEAMREKNIHLLTALTASTFYTGFNMRDPIVGGDGERARKLRHAIAIAVDFEEFVSIFANGRGIVAQGPIPPGIFGAREGEAAINPHVYDWADGRPRRKSISVARDLMRQAGYPDGRDTESGKGLVLNLDAIAAGPGGKAQFDWLRKQFDKLGIGLVVRATDYNRFQEKMRKGTAQIYQWGWNADYPDPENFMFLLYGANAKVHNNGENASNYTNAEFDHLFEKMKNMENGAPRQRLIDQMVEIARHDSPWLWGYHPLAFSLHHEWYKNAKPNLMANNQLKYKRIDPLTRQVKRRQWNRPYWLVPIVVMLTIGICVVPAYRYHRRREEAHAL